jgi:purine-binding chemotaxis protein CheW
MAKSLTASKQVMQHYLSELLTEEKPVKEKQPDPQLEKLLQQVAQPAPATAESALTSTRSDSTVKRVVSEPTTLEQQLVTAKSSQPLKIETQKSYRQGSFQAMFFNVAGLTVAVPLIDLGGIHNVDKMTSLMGKPAWFKGVMLHREDKINVVDTALWVMPEKCDETLRNSLNYQYIIMLSDSCWGLSAEQLVDTVTLHQDDVKWLDGPNKRPWLAGLVKERKCALLDVNSMIQLLNEGASINDDKSSVIG